MRPSSGHGRAEAVASPKRSSARTRRTLYNLTQTPPYKQSASWWELHAVLTRHLKRHGFQGASLIALRVLSEGVYPAVFTVLLAYWLAIRNAEAEWEGRR